jgi:hypothetical protein
VASAKVFYSKVAEIRFCGHNFSKNFILRFCGFHFLIETGDEASAVALKPVNPLLISHLNRETTDVELFKRSYRLFGEF